ncbi:MAG: hypothetical protein IT379_00840, partial [Deltaproteobacteria bacterium]|nr:hypothetical protein [Deltaproteobacteria bacterium]
MRVGGLARLARRDLARGKAAFLLAGTGVAVAIGALAFFLALGRGVRAVLLGKVVRVDEIEVVPRAGGADSVLSLLGA